MNKVALIKQFVTEKQHSFFIDLKKLPEFAILFDLNLQSHSNHRTISKMNRSLYSME